LAEVQAAREELAVGAANSRALAAPTVSVASVNPVTQPIPAGRPAWARLPGRDEPPRPPARRRRAAPSGGLVDSYHRITSTSRGRQAVAAVILVLGLLVAVGGWWFGVGQYTTAPSLMGLTKAQAAALAQQDGFQLAFDGGRYDEKI